MEQVIRGRRVTFLRGFTALDLFDQILREMGISASKYIHLLKKGGVAAVLPLWGKIVEK